MTPSRCSGTWLVIRTPHSWWRLDPRQTREDTLESLVRALCVCVHVCHTVLNFHNNFWIFHMSDLQCICKTTNYTYEDLEFCTRIFSRVYCNEQTNQLHVHVHDINWGVLNHAPQLKSRNCYNYYCAMLYIHCTCVCMRLCVVIRVVCVGGGRGQPMLANKAKLI